MAHFLLRLSPPRPGFPADATAAEMEAMAAHSAFWQAKADRGIALAVGPVADPSGIWGMALVDVPDEDEANGLTCEDPVMRAELGFTYQVMPLLSLIRSRAAGPVSDTNSPADS